MTSIHDQIKEVVTTHRVVLFMKGTKQFPQCGFSSRAVQILNAAGCTDYVTVNVWKTMPSAPISAAISAALRPLAINSSRVGISMPYTLG